jgi:hypothetical protein
MASVYIEILCMSSQAGFRRVTLQSTVFGVIVFSGVVLFFQIRCGGSKTSTESMEHDVSNAVCRVHSRFEAKERTENRELGVKVGVPVGGTFSVLFLSLLSVAEGRRVFVQESHQNEEIQ